MAQPPWPHPPASQPRTPPPPAAGPAAPSTPAASAPPSAPPAASTPPSAPPAARPALGTAPPAGATPPVSTPPREQSPAGPPPVPPRPAAPAAAPPATPPTTPPATPPAATPAAAGPAEAAPVRTPVAAPAPRIVQPRSVTPAPSTPARPSAQPTPPGGTPVPPPYASVPVPGVRRSGPLPPIPGRDLPLPHPGEAGKRPAPVRAPVSPARRRLTRVALALVALLGLVAAYYVGLYFYVDRSIDRVDALVVDGPEVLAPQLQEGSQTYLVVGTGLPGRTGPAAVSTLIAHVSGEGEQAVLVTVPPTALSDTPTCRDSDGDVRPAVTEPFAAALLDGGPSCLVRSVQQLTGLRVDHYLALDLDRLPGMVDALGEVPVCLTADSAGTASRLALPAGEHQLAGSDVTGFLQGTGDDVTGAGMAEREQLVLTSTLGTALAGGTLADPLTLTRFLTRAGDAFTLDAETTLGDVRALGATLGDLSGDAVERGAVPVAQVGYLPAGSDQAAVVVDATATRELFDAVIDGGRLPAAAVVEAPAAPETAPDASAGTAPADSLPAPATTDPVPEGTVVTIEPAGVTVDVLDATGGGRVAEVADGLAAQGFQVRARGVEPGAVDRTVVRYGPASLEVARTVAAAVPGSVLLETDAVGSSVQLVVGPDYTALAPVALGTPVPTTAAPAPVDGEAGAASSCG
nr:LCP family protein [Modestobacter versicolor]